MILPYLKQNHELYSDFIFALLPQLFGSCKENYVNSVKNFISNKLNSYTEEKEFYYGLSCVLGAFLGDAMGSYAEFNGPDDNNRKLVWADVNKVFGTRKGQVTDDSEMAMCDAYALLEGNGLYNPDRIAYFYRMWIRSQPFDKGNTMTAAITGGSSDNSVIYYDGLAQNMRNNSKTFNGTSLSNGFLMKATPLAVWLHFNFKDYIEYEFSQKRFSAFDVVYHFIQDEASMSHPNPEAHLALFIYCFIIFEVIRQQVKNQGTSITSCFEKVWESTVTFLDHLEMKDFQRFSRYPFKGLIREIKDKKISSKSEAIAYLKSKKMGTENIGYYYHALTLCLFFLKNISFFSNEINSFDEIILLICDLGGDTDTNAAILGGILGGGYGFRSFSTKATEMLNCIIAPGGSRTDGRRGLYSPGFILFTMDELYKFR